jgi:uncharacterized membrane protein YccC
MQAAGAESSLGLALIFNQPLPIRSVLGTIYLYLFPIPFWSGFSLSSFYHIFKGFNALLFYAVIPMLLQGLWVVWKQRNLRTPQILFTLFAALGFSVAIAITSAENRHLGAFLPIVFIFALLPDYSKKKERKVYRKLITAMVVGMMFIHFLWVLVKL